MPIVELRGVSKAFSGKPAIEGISIAAEPGSLWVITGKSGAGKTTLVRIILGLLRPDSGIVQYSDEKAPPLFAGTVFQEDRLCEDLDAVKNIIIATRNADESAAADWTDELLGPGNRGKLAGELSGGMRRRVCILRALMSEADILVMDEPFSGMDAETRENAFEFIMRHRNGRALIMTSHSGAGFGEFQEIRLGPTGKN